MTNPRDVYLHLGTYRNVAIGIYEFCSGFFSLPFAARDSGYYLIAENQTKNATKINDDEENFLIKETLESSIADKKDKLLKQTEKDMQEEYIKDPNIFISKFFEKGTRKISKK